MFPIWLTIAINRCPVNSTGLSKSRLNNIAQHHIISMFDQSPAPAKIMHPRPRPSPGQNHAPGRPLSILGLPTILKNLVFYSKFDYSVRFLNSKNVISLRKTVDECKSCWFANLFLNFLILRALSRKKVPKIRNFICCLSRLFLRIL